MKVVIQWVRVNVDALEPTQSFDDDAGWDLPLLQSDIIPPYHKDWWLKTGLSVAVPVGNYMRICARSSTWGKGLQVVEGVIDPGYRGELRVRVHNLTMHPIPVSRGDRLAQAIIHEIPKAEWVLALALPPSEGRNLNGFGSTGSGCFQPETNEAGARSSQQGPESR